MKHQRDAGRMGIPRFFENGLEPPVLCRDKKIACWIHCLVKPDPTKFERVMSTDAPAMNIEDMFRLL